MQLTKYDIEPMVELEEADARANVTDVLIIRDYEAH